MDIRIEELTPGRKEDFFDFFDNRAFSDHGEWAGCYCLESRLRSENNVEYLPDGREVRREDRKAVAGELIDSGVMTGYLIYDGGTAVGWCSAGEKSGFWPLTHNDLFRTDEPEKGRIMAVYCLDIAPEYRGRGLASAVLERVIADARAAGYAFLEGFPFSDTTFAYQYHGPGRLYEKHGFTVCRRAGWVDIMRLEL